MVLIYMEVLRVKYTYFMNRQLYSTSLCRIYSLKVEDGGVIKFMTGPIKKET